MINYQCSIYAFKIVSDDYPSNASDVKNASLEPLWTTLDDVPLASDVNNNSV